MTKIHTGEGRNLTVPSLSNRYRQQNAAIMEFVNSSVFKS